MKKKTIIIIISFVVLVLIAVFLTYELVRIESSKKNIKINSQVLEGNNTVENVNNIIENNVINNVIQNNVIKNNIDEEAMDEETNNTNSDNITKAIEIAKNNWGEDTSVYFIYDKDHPTNANGEYIIYVRDKQTTNVLHWYNVNLKTKTFTIDL